MRNWYDSISDKAKKNVFDADTNYIIKFVASNSDFNEINVISALAKNITALAIEDWNDDTVNKFTENIRRVIDNVKKYEQNETAGNEQQASISLNIDGVTYEKNLADTEISAIAETTLNNIEEILEDYGDSITAQERISVLLKLLKKEIDQI